MLTRTIAIEMGRRARNLCCIALHPGTTDTALSAPFQRRVPQGKLFTAAFAVERLLGIVDSVEPEHSGRFYAWDGSEISW